MKLLLDMYKSAPKEQRDKVQLMAAERKAKAEVGLLEQSVLPRHIRALSQQGRWLVFILTVWSKLIVVLLYGPTLRASFLWMQVDELRSRIRELEERDRRESKKIADEDALRRIRQAEEQIEHLQRKLGATKQVKCPVVSLLLNLGIPLALPVKCHQHVTFWSSPTPNLLNCFPFPSSLPTYRRRRRYCQRWM